eukprot:g14203.t1
MIADDLEDPLLRRPSIVRSKGRLLDTDSRPSGVWEAPRQVLGRLRRLARTTLHLFHPPHVPETSTSSPQRDDHVTTPFEDSFMKLLTGAQYNLDTVGPYARLHLTVHGASRLLAQDYCGTSDPYVEVYVNDIKRGQSRHVNFTLNPQWNFSEVVDIWSPFSIITLRIMLKKSYKLTYFDIRGLAENSRTIKRPEFDAMKAAGQLDSSLGKVPLLEVDGAKIGQSKAIERFLAKELGMMGSNSVEVPHIDSIGCSATGRDAQVGQKDVGRTVHNK